MKAIIVYLVLIMLFSQSNVKNSIVKQSNMLKDNITNIDYSRYKVGHKSKKIAYDYQIDVNRVIECKSIYYYGVDITHLTLADDESIGSQDYLNKYLVAWVYFYDKNVEPNNRLEKWFKKEEIIPRQNIIQNKNKIDGREWVTSSPNDISIEEVAKIIKNYKSSIKEDSGIGFVIIIDTFDKKTKEASVILNFFDIHSGSLLWSTKIYGEAGATSKTAYWGVGIIKGLKYYVDLVYTKARKKVKAENKLK